jgi:hypothetical protein
MNAYWIVGIVIWVMIIAAINHYYFEEPDE